jgi:two-component system response regulator FixJ
MADGTVVHVIDDDAAVRDSISFLLRSAGIAAVTHESAPAFLDGFPQADAGCVVTDVRMPDLDGISLLKRIVDLGRAVPVIVITGHGDVPLAVEAMKAGAIDFIEKPFRDETLLAAVRSALRASEGRIASEAHEANARQKVALLSLRERQVLDGLVEGHANKVIAHELGISPRTVEIYRANVMTKMGAASLSELVRMAIAAGTINREPSTKG